MRRAGSYPGIRRDPLQQFGFLSGREFGYGLGEGMVGPITPNYKLSAVVDGDQRTEPNIKLTAVYSSWVNTVIGEDRQVLTPPIVQ